MEVQHRMLSQLAACGTSMVNEERKDDNTVDSFEPTYLYDAMREKRQLRPLLISSCALVALLLMSASLMCIGRPTAGCGRVSLSIP